MRNRRLGKTGFNVSELGFGCWQIGGSMWGAVDVPEAVRAMHRAVELGVNLFDTALVYGMGRSEQLVGRVVRELPSGHGVMVATKIPPKNMAWPAADDTPLEDAYPADHVRARIDDCLKNLGLDRVELLQLHVWADAWTDRDDLWRVLADARASGKIGAVGISINAGRPATGVRAVASGHVDAVQVVYNLFDQQPDDVLLPACAKHDVGVIARVPFDEGGLTGKLAGNEVFASDDFRSRYFAGGLLAETVKRAGELRTALGPAAATDLASAALRFCLSSPAVSCVIPGMRKVPHVVANVEAVAAGPLDAQTLAAVRTHRWTPRAHD